MNVKLRDLQQEAEKTEQVNAFYISFSDLMLLLCVFFVMIIGISRVDIGSFERVRAGVTGKGTATLADLAKQLSRIAKKHHGVTVEMASDGVRIDFESAALFQAGKAVLEQDYLKPLRPMLKEIQATPYSIEIEGHTEDRPYYVKSGEEVETNWSLSGRRAGAMADYLIDLGYKPGRIRIVGYSFTKPKVPIKGLEGQDLATARAKNRRVTILVK